MTAPRTSGIVAIGPELLSSVLRERVASPWLIPQNGDLPLGIPTRTEVLARLLGSSRESRMRRLLLILVFFGAHGSWAAEPPRESVVIPYPDAFQTLVNPACSHCIDEAKRRSGELRADDRVLAWIRGYSDGGAIPHRFFLNSYRVISDSYGVFVYDPDAGFARGFAPSYEFSFYGWRKGVMVMRHKDGTLYSCLTGIALDGPQKGARLQPVPTMVSDWGFWLKRYPDGVAYNMFDRYQPIELPREINKDSLKSRGPADPRLPAEEAVLGVWTGKAAKAYPLARIANDRLVVDEVAGEPLVVFWEPSTKTAVAYKPIAHQPRKFHAPRPDKTGVSPLDLGDPLPAGAAAVPARKLTLELADKSAGAPYLDRETGSRWDITGRAISGELKGWTLTWLESTQVKWFAWAAEYPETAILATTNSAATETPLKGVLISEEQTDADRLRSLRAEDFNSVVLALDGVNAAKEREAARAIEAAGFGLYYWIEIGRNPELADAHPEWMASLDVHHSEWRRLFPKFPQAKAGEVVKNYPWVPVLYEETFPVHLARVKKLLADKPPPRGVLLNDLQGPPSSCGCGHHLCRWATDYGPVEKATAKRMPKDAAAKFVAAVQKLSPEAKVIPVWATECEEHDKEELCAGVNCFQGACWREWTAQLTPLAAEAETIAALLPYRAFQRDLPRYGTEAGWIKEALEAFSAMPSRDKAKGVPPHRLVAVLQGWDVTPEQVAAQIAQAKAAGAAGYVVSRMKLNQDWEPRILKVMPKGGR